MSVCAVRFKITSPTFGIIDAVTNGKRLLFPSILSLLFIQGPVEGARLVEVSWEGRKLLMFAHDLRMRAVPYSDQRNRGPFSAL